MKFPAPRYSGPAFGILSTSTTLRRANDINTLVYTGVSANTSPTAASPDRPRGTSIDIANLEALAVNPGDGQIVNHLNALLLHGTMSTQMRNSIITAMNAINDTNLTTRHQKRARARGLPGGNFFTVRHTEITTMATYTQRLSTDQRLRAWAAWRWLRASTPLASFRR